VGYDAVHQVSPAHHASCLEYGLLAENQFLVPYGFTESDYRMPSEFDLAAAREKLGIPPDVFVVLSLAALNKTHKRIDWLIEEFAAYSKDRKAFLLLVGNHELETDELRKLAESHLKPHHWKMLQVPFDDVPGVLWLSNVMVQCSLDEGFGRTLVEAMLSGVPLLAHPHPTAKFLIRANTSLVDMTTPGELSAALKRLDVEPALQKEISNSNQVGAQRFTWDNLVSDYLGMYKQILATQKSNQA
jgi:glycosyltransferase involved in cell wall biosynthesis